MIKIPEIKMVRIDDLIKNKDNPRTVKDANFNKLVQSIKDLPEMLGIRPVVHDGDMMILGGNMRFEAAKAAGLTEIPAVDVRYLSEDQKREFIIKDNISGGEWDYTVLSNEWNVERLIEWGIEKSAFDNKGDNFNFDDPEYTEDNVSKKSIIVTYYGKNEEEVKDMADKIVEKIPGTAYYDR